MNLDSPFREALCLFSLHLPHFPHRKCQWDNALGGIRRKNIDFLLTAVGNSGAFPLF